MDTKEKITYNACQGWGCHEMCVLTTYSKDEKILRTERTIIKGVRPERYDVCQKGIISGKFPYLPERLLYPLKRVGKRGEGKFERISWEQAFDEIGGKLNELREKYGPRSLVLNLSPMGYPNNMSSLANVLQYRFVHSYDATVMELQPNDMSANMTNICDYGDLMVEFRENIMYWSKHKPKYLIIWGGNPIGWTRGSTTTRILLDIQDAGGKIVDIGAIYDTTAAKADEFIPIKPGTDAALALSMANLLIKEKLYDEKFLIERTVAPFLIREDNGLFLRESDIVSGGNPNNYVIWNITPDKPVAIGSHVYEIAGIYPNLYARVIINGIHCRTVFSALEEHVAQWTPESQEPITGVPANTARRIALEFAHNKPSTIFLYFGMRYFNGGNSGRSVSLLPVLNGSLADPDARFLIGPLGMGYPIDFNDATIMFPDGIDKAKGGVASLDEIMDSFTSNTGQQYKAFINAMGNPVQNWPNRSLWKDKIFNEKYMDLVVSFEVRMCDTALFADYVLPEANTFEREDLICPADDCIILNEPAIKPLGESKPPADIWRELAKRVGLEKYFNKTTEDWLNVRLETHDPAIAGVKPPITLDRLRKEKIIRLNVPDEIYDEWGSMEYHTPSGRVELYREELADTGLPMATYVEPQIHSPKKAIYPLQLFPGRHRFFMQGQFQEFPELRALAGYKAVVALNPITAREKGINEGDWVEVYNEKGSVQVTAHLSNMFPPGMAHLWYSYSAKDYPTDPPTVLSSSLGTHDVEDAFSRKVVRVLMKQPYAGLPATATFPLGGANETFWDDLVDVRKIDGGK